MTPPKKSYEQLSTRSFSQRESTQSSLQVSVPLTEPQISDDTAPVETFITKRGAVGVSYQGFCFVKDKQREKHTTWRCSVQSCRSRLKLTNNFVLISSNNVSHNHEKPLKPTTQIERKPLVSNPQFIILLLLLNWKHILGETWKYEY